MYLFQGNVGGNLIFIAFYSQVANFVKNCENLGWIKHHFCLFVLSLYFYKGHTVLTESVQSSSSSPDRSSSEICRDPCQVEATKVLPA